MLIYIFSFLLNILIGLLIFKGKALNKSDKAKKWYLYLTVIQLTVLAGFRGYYVGFDTDSYTEIFNRIAVSNYSVLNTETWLEIGFVIYCKLISLFGGNAQCMIFLSSAIINISVCRFIYKYSIDVFMSVYLLMCFPYYYYSFDIIRYFIAISIILFFYKYIVERRFIATCIVIIFASTFHSGAIFLFAFYFLYKFKLNAVNTIITVPIIVIVGLSFSELYIFFFSIGDVFGRYIYDSYWFGGSSGGYVTAIMYVVILILGIIAHSINRSDRKHTELISNDAIIGILIVLAMSSILFTRARMMIRIMLFCLPFLAVGFPNLVYVAIKDRVTKDNYFVLTYETLLIKICIMAIALYYHVFMLLNNVQNIIPYYPFWNN